MKIAWPHIFGANVGHVVFPVAMGRKADLRLVTGQEYHVVAEKYSENFTPK